MLLASSPSSIFLPFSALATWGHRPALPPCYLCPLILVALSPLLLGTLCLCLLPLLGSPACSSIPAQVPPLGLPDMAALSITAILSSPYSMCTGPPAFLALSHWLVLLRRTFCSVTHQVPASCRHDPHWPPAKKSPNMEECSLGFSLVKILVFSFIIPLAPVFLRGHNCHLSVLFDFQIT